jgi:peptide/nickel transport system permease protein
VSTAEAEARAWLVSKPSTQAWRRLRRDGLAFASGVFIAFLLLACFVGEPIAERLLGHTANDIFPSAVNSSLTPVGPWTWVPALNTSAVPTAATPRTLFILGADGPLGRNEFLRVLAGGRASLEIGIGATAIALLLGTVFGMLAGFYRGWVDSGISRLTEFVMGFPILFLVIALGLTVSDRLNSITLGGLMVPGVLSLFVVIGLFSWFYTARIVRAQVLSLREREFVEAARMIGASDLYIMRKHLFPHLIGSLLVYGSLTIAGTIMLEAALAILNVGIKIPYASWGNMIATSWGTLLVPDSATATAYVTSTWTTIWPTAALFASVLAFALFGEGLRRLVDPHGESY